MLTHSFLRFGSTANIRLKHFAGPLCAQLDNACVPLADLAKEIEARFLACGSALQEQAKLTALLAAQSRQLNEFDRRVDQGEAAIRRIGTLISAHLKLSEGLAAEVGRLASTLDDHACQLLQLQRDQLQLERCFAPMRMLHSFFRIESTVLSPELQTLFHAVTTDMQRLHTDVSASFAEQTATLDGVRKQVLATAKQLHAQSAECAARTVQKRTEVQRSLARLEVELAKSRQRNGGLKSAVVDLDRETDAILVGLQYQDITRQKMEHVQAVARDVLGRFAQPDGTPFQSRVRLQKVLCQVQAVQLASVQEELQGATNAITSGLRGILRHLQKIESECLSLDGLQQITAGMDAVTAEMSEAHRLSVEFMRVSLASLTQAIQTARGFAAATTGATDTMRRLAVDLHMMGLNTQVQAVQANNGSLEVLAGAAAAIAGEAGTLTLAFERKLVATTEALATLVQASEAAHEKNRHEHAALQAQDETIFQQLTEEHQAGKELVQNVGSLLRQLKVQADELLGSVDLAEFSRDAIESTRDIFTALVEACAKVSTGDALGDEAVLAEVQSRYTMHSERTAHSAALGGQGGRAPSASPAITAGDGFELFDEPATVHSAAGSPISDNVELF